MWFPQSEIIFCINLEVRGINIIASADLFEQFWFMDSSLLHEIDDIIVMVIIVILEIVQLNSQFKSQLSFFTHKFKLFRISKAFVILWEQMEFSVCYPWMSNWLFNFNYKLFFLPHSNPSIQLCNIFLPSLNIFYLFFCSNF